MVYWPRNACGLLMLGLFLSTLSPKMVGFVCETRKMGILRDSQRNSFARLVKWAFCDTHKRNRFTGRVYLNQCVVYWQGMPAQSSLTTAAIRKKINSHSF